MSLPPFLYPFAFHAGQQALSVSKLPLTSALTSALDMTNEWAL